MTADKQLLEPLHKPVLVLPANRDDAAVLQVYLPVIYSINLGKINNKGVMDPAKLPGRQPGLDITKFMHAGNDPAGPGYINQVILTFDEDNIRYRYPEIFATAFRTDEEKVGQRGNSGENWRHFLHRFNETLERKRLQQVIGYREVERLRPVFPEGGGQDDFSF